MSIRRRRLLAGLAGMGAVAAWPAAAQWNKRDVIGPSTDPYGRVDPYAGDTSRSMDGRTREPPKQPRPPAPEAEKELPLPSPLDTSDETEIILGEALFPNNIKESGGAVRDQHLQAALRAFCQPIFKASMRSTLPWQVVLTNDRSVNAAAGPAGKVVVNIGAVAACNHPNELASILAHESGHVDFRHVMKSMQTIQLLREAFKNLAIDSTQPMSAQQKTMFAEFVAKNANSLVLSYEREHELEADNHICYIFARLGMDPAHGVEMLKVLKRTNGGHKFNPMTDNHPDVGERIQLLSEAVSRSPRPNPEFIPPGWDILKAAFPTPPAYRNS